jgi:hypothetical protein
VLRKSYLILVVILISVGVTSAYAEPEIKVISIIEKSHPSISNSDVTVWEVSLSGNGFYDDVNVKGTICLEIDLDCDVTFSGKTDEFGTFDAIAVLFPNVESGLYQMKANDGINDFFDEIFLELQVFPDNSFMWQLNKKEYVLNEDEVFDIRGTMTDDLDHYEQGISLNFFDPAGNHQKREYFTADEDKFHFAKTIRFNSPGTWMLVFEYTGLVRVTEFEVIDPLIDERAEPETQTQIDPPSLQLDAGPSDTSSQKIPDWVKNTMGWYAEGLISEDEMISAIQYLVNEGIIKLN